MWWKSFLSFCLCFMDCLSYKEVLMADQGRLIRVIFLLMAAMTMGALTLLALEGKPIKPMAYSLSGQIGSPAIHKVLGAEVGIESDRWQKVEIFRRSNNGPNGRLSSLGPVGSFAMEYHFVISGGEIGYDGQIYASPRWSRQENCLTSENTSDLNGVVRICLIAKPGQSNGTSSQHCQLKLLVASLKRHCQM